MTSLFRKSKISRSITTNQSSFNPFIWCSSSLDPYLNLSIEEYLFRNVNLNNPILFIYRNRKECDNRQEPNPQTPESYHKQSKKWVSQKWTSLIDMMFQDQLLGLQVNEHTIMNIVDSKAVGSVRSPVTSLIKNSNTYNTQKEVNHVQFMNTLSREFTRHYYPNSDRCLSKTQVLGETELQTNPIIKTGYDELKSWNWIYGQTPQFTRRIEVEIDDTKNHQIPVEITYKNGVISETKINLGSYSSSVKDL
ncbi:hypothetical protein PSTT_12120 [Puccinia striiformis]|uniref:Uncharacterized protein n=1 Tax=Puccinia striiformis TaxID=27350 RepID=A0A2S4UXD7_9BASI|nr:hypothetical protein PSTT_12120 [Puccinia striiformis]